MNLFLKHALRKAAKVLGDEEHYGGRSEEAALVIISSALGGERLRVGAEQFLDVKDRDMQIGALKLLRCLGYDARKSAEKVLGMLEGNQFVREAVKVEAIETLGIIGNKDTGNRLAAFQKKAKRPEISDAVTEATKALKLQP